jgi:hypothetical protein
VWYFSANGDGRFDPTGSYGRGTCYLAEDPLGAWIETFRTVTTVAEPDVLGREMGTVELDRPLVLADLTVRSALSAGVTAALSNSERYDESQALADRLQNRVDGVRWRLRHDPKQELLGVALFGPAGGQPDDDWPPARNQPLDQALIREAEDNFGYRIVPTL